MVGSSINRVAAERAMYPVFLIASLRVTFFSWRLFSSSLAISEIFFFIVYAVYDF